eukprot:TRINITY_DN14038_c0_g1_i6.p1 TRINITY_DN14038_c0_g1~~TRINITY_DN14038_c0_g1_i6.p1  ORF type:complete len:240 (+),score=21.73 TRINITY_DN14038_c0_g1_i6:77-796(+)
MRALVVAMHGGRCVSLRYFVFLVMIVLKSCHAMMQYGSRWLLQASCAISRERAFSSAPAQGWSHLLNMQLLRQNLVIAAQLDALVNGITAELSSFFPRLSYDHSGNLNSQFRRMPNWTSPGIVDFRNCGAGFLSVHLLVVRVLLDVLPQRDIMEATSTVIYNLVQGHVDWLQLMRSGWPIFMQLSWISRGIVQKYGAEFVFRVAFPPLEKYSHGLVELKRKLRRDDVATCVVSSSSHDR